VALPLSALKHVAGLRRADNAKKQRKTVRLKSGPKSENKTYDHFTPFSEQASALGRALPEEFYLKQRNNLITIIKNYGRPNLIRFLPLRTVQDLFSFTYYLMKKDRARSLPIPAAYFWLIRNLRPVLTSRYVIQKHRKVKDKEIIDVMLKKSVAIQHYLLNRKYFSQLGGLPRDLSYYMSRHSAAD
jgi:hypothetical protein